MSITNVGNNRVYASIQDIPQTSSLINGDRIIIQTDDGTKLVDYENIKIDLNHTTFGSQFSEMVSYVTLSTTTLTELLEKTEAIDDEINYIKSDLQKLKAHHAIIQFIIKGITGAYDKTNSPAYKEYKKIIQQSQQAETYFESLAGDFGACNSLELDGAQQQANFFHNYNIVI